MTASGKERMAERGEAWDYLHHLYHERRMTFGRDRLYKFAQANRSDLVAKGLSRRFVSFYLESQECHQLFKPARTMPEIQSTVPLQPFNIVGMDLIDMHSMEVRGYIWALTAIDLFSRKGYCAPLKSKSAEEVVRGFALMLYGNTQQLRIHKHNSKDMRSNSNWRSWLKLLRKAHAKHLFCTAGRKSGETEKKTTKKATRGMLGIRRVSKGNSRSRANIVQPAHAEALRRTAGRKNLGKQRKIR